MLEVLNNNPFALGCATLAVFAFGFGSGQVVLLLWEMFAAGSRSPEETDMLEYEGGHPGAPSEFGPSIVHDFTRGDRVSS